jgi:O-antigen biosynthesis protein WbqP
LTLPVLIAVYVVVRSSSPGPAIYWSNRVGQDEILFAMPKFRTMRIDTPAVATHLLADPDAWLTPVGHFLRSTSLDELPQLWSILRGDMSFVGPRPALFNQHDLVAERRKYGVNACKPGLTGLAQVTGRDSLSIRDKAAADGEYVRKMSFVRDVAILWSTFIKVLLRRDVAH